MKLDVETSKQAYFLYEQTQINIDETKEKYEPLLKLSARELKQHLIDQDTLNDLLYKFVCLVNRAY